MNNISRERLPRAEFDQVDRYQLDQGGKGLCLSKETCKARTDVGESKLPRSVILASRSRGAGIHHIGRCQETNLFT